VSTPGPQPRRGIARIFDTGNPLVDVIDNLLNRGKSTDADGSWRWPISIQYLRLSACQRAPIAVARRQMTLYVYAITATSALSNARAPHRVQPALSLQVERLTS
jgi:hypothetical protein